VGNPRAAAGNYLDVVADNRVAVVADIRAPQAGVADSRPGAEAADNRSAAVVEGSRPAAAVVEGSRPAAAVVDTRQEAGVVDRSSVLPEVVRA
jgi:hypothetical protein